MTAAPDDLLAFRQTVINLTGLGGLSVGIVGDATHAATGGYHEGVTDLTRVGRYHTGYHTGSVNEDYSVRLQRDRDGLTDHASAIDIGYQWPRGGSTAWLRFNHLLVTDLQNGHPALAAVRAVNYTPDGSALRRIDRQNGFAVETSSDSVDIHTHIEMYRDTEGHRQPTLDRLTALIQAAIADTNPPGDDMAGADADYAATHVPVPGKPGAVQGSHIALSTLLETSAALLAAVGKIGQPTADQITAQANAITKALIASNSNGLTAADHAAVQADLEAVLRRGVGPA